MNQEIVNILFNFLPEITLAISVLILNVIQSFRKEKAGIAYYIFLGGIALSALFSLMQAYYAPQQLFGGTISADHFSYGGKVLITSAMLIVALAFYNRDSSNDLSLMLVSLVGSLLSVSSSNLFVLFISLQVMVIPLYLLIYYRIKPAIKYFIFSSMFMAVMLYGSTLVYGVTGFGNYIEAAKFLSFNPFNVLIIITALIFITSGFAFLTLMAPFNLSFPLLAEKIRLPHLVQFTVINVITIILVMGRFYTTVFHDSNTFITNITQYNFISGVNWQLMLAVISGLSILAGNLIILWQYDLKKIVTYIIISQAGYILMGIISGSPAGITAMIFGLIVFILNSLGLLFCIDKISLKYNVKEIDGLKGLGKYDKLLFLSFFYFLLSSAGFPLSAGFTSKILLYLSLGSTSYFMLIAIGILSSAVFLYFIFKLTLVIFSGKNEHKTAKIETLSNAIMFILLLSNILLGFYFDPVLNWSRYCTNLIGI